MNVLFKSKLLLTLIIVIFAVILSEILVYLQLKIFWQEITKETIYYIGFWTPLIDAFFVAIALIYLRSVFEKEIKQKNLILEEAKKIASIGEWELNLDTMKAKWSHNIIHMLGLPKKTIDAGPDLLESLMYKEDWREFETSMNNCVLGKSEHKCIYRIRRADNNKTRWIECRGKLNKKTRQIIGTVQDITGYKDIEKKINTYHDLIDENIITSSTDLDGNITTISKAFCEISGYTHNELIGQNHRIIKHPEMDNSIYKDLWETITSDKTWTGEIRNLKNDGSDYWVKATIYPIFEDGQKVGYTAIRQDITDKKLIEELSITDGLTGIFNRRHFNELFPKIINSTRRNNELLCFLIMDIDYFKQYNDTYGHQEGDKVLKQIATTIKESLKRADDYCFRLGGEEFGVLFKADTKDKALSFAHDIKDSIEKLKIPHEKNTCSNYITTSIGLICENAENLEDSDNIYKQADDLLYKAKSLGKNIVCS